MATNPLRAVSPVPISSAVKSGAGRHPSMPGEFFRDLSDKTIGDFESLAVHFSCPVNTVLIHEAQDPASVLILLGGNVNLYMNSFAGRHLILGIANPGEVLGLTSAISGKVSEIGAEARSFCSIAVLQRGDFLAFLLRHPVASLNVARELSHNYTRACEKIRILGLSSSVLEKLAALLLEWCKHGEQTENGTKVRCLLTHGEIAECIGASREAVTRNMTDFRHHKLVELHGSALVIPSRAALASYAGIG